MLIQLTVNESHKEVYNLIQRLEEEGNGKRGYVTEQLRIRLKMFELLSELYNEEDPSKLALMLAKGSAPEDKKESVSTRETKGLLSQFTNMEG